MLHLSSQPATINRLAHALWVIVSIWKYYEFHNIHYISKSICPPALTHMQYELKCHPIPNP